MQINSATISRTCPEHEVYESLLDLDGKNILELGCGRADLTRQIARHGSNRKITATEVDAVQHAQNLLIDDLPNVTFIAAGSQAIPLEDASFDLVLAFKSLHHVPTELMDRALSEIARVLKPGGLAYISEPIFAGDFNEVLRLFHDEEEVRKQAFAALCRAVETGKLEAVDQVFFNSPIQFKDFSEFEKLVIHVSHSQHQLSPELHHEVKRRFLQNQQAQGYAFSVPIRVDLLRKA